MLPAFAVSDWNLSFLWSWLCQNFSESSCLWSCNSGIPGSWHAECVRAFWSQAAFGILKSWSAQAPEILLYQSSWESSFLRVLQEWVWNQSPGFTLGTSISWKEPVPLGGQGFVLPWSLSGLQLHCSASRYYLKSLVLPKPLSDLAWRLRVSIVHPVGSTCRHWLAGKYLHWPALFLLSAVIKSMVLPDVLPFT